MKIRLTSVFMGKGITMTTNKTLLTLSLLASLTATPALAADTLDNAADYNYVNGQRAELDTRITNEVKELNDNVERTNVRINGEISNINNRMNDEISGINNRMNSEISGINNLITSQVGIINDRVTNEVKELNDNVERTNTRINGEISNINNRMNDEISGINNRVNSEISRIDGNVEAANQRVSSVQNDMANLSDQLNGRMDAINPDPTTLNDLKSGIQSANDGVMTVNNRLNHEVSRLDGRIDSVGARTAALAGLHPLDFDAANKFNLAAAMGGYGNRQAAAIGAFYRPNQNLMFSAATSITGGDSTAYNLGVSAKFGPSSKVTPGTQNARLAHLEEENTQLKTTVATMNEKMDAMIAELQALKANK